MTQPRESLASGQPLFWSGPPDESLKNPQETTTAGALAGIRVLDAGNMIAGPMATVLLADHGADVIKLEHPKHLDPLRDWEPKKDGVSLWWKVTNRGKRLATLDLSTDDGRKLFLGLTKWADVVFENFRPGTLERWGLDYDCLAEVNPGIVLVRISGYGQTGPLAERPGYGTIAEAMSGIPYFTGPEAAPPTLPGFPMADTVTGVFAAMGALAALLRRDKDPEGRGQEVDIALYESLFRLVDSQVIGFDQLGIVKRRMGNRLSEDAPRNGYRTSDDRWIAISASSNKTWARLATAIGHPKLSEDSRFVGSSERVRNGDELDQILGDWFSKRTCDEAMRILEEHDVTAGPVLNIEDILQHPQYRARQNVVEVDDPDFGPVLMQGVVPKFSRTPGRVQFPGLSPGAHNHEVYLELLGKEETELLDLAARGVI